MSRSCNKEQLLVFIVRRSISLKHAIVSLTYMRAGLNMVPPVTSSLRYSNTLHSVNYLVEVVEVV